MKKIGRIFLVMVIGWGSLVFGAQGNRERLCGRLSMARTDAALKEELTKYRLKALEYTDGTNTFGGLLYSPRVRSTKRFPMVVYFPGCGEKGKLIRQFRQRLIFDRVTAEAFQRKHPCHLLALSPPDTATTLHGGMPGRPNEYQRLAHDFVLAVCRESKVGVDTDCLYVTGFSYGGSGAYALSLHYPGEFAAVVPISSLPPLKEYFSEKNPGNWWHIYNEGDYEERGIVPLGLREFCRRTNEAGGDFRIASFPEKSHDAWTRAWSGEAVWDWMFSKTLNATAQRMSATKRLCAATMNLGRVRCSASVPGGNAGCGPDRVLDGLDETAYRPDRKFTKKDWWMAQFPESVAGKVEIYSGETNGTHRLKNAIVEVSSNGRTWDRAGSFSPQSGICRFTRANRFTHLRIKPSSDKMQPFILRRMTVTKSR